MIKRDELRAPNSCLNRAAGDEPIFVLRAKDCVAPQAVRHWATMAYGEHESAKRDEALTLADQMEAWRDQNGTVPTFNSNPCVCGDRSNPHVVHRTDGPCFMAPDPDL